MFDPRHFVDDAAERKDVLRLVGLLAHARPEVRASAARELEKLEGPHSTDDLVLALDDASGDMRRSAAQALGAVGGTAAIGPLVSKMLSEAPYAERWHAAISLGRIGDPIAIEALTRALADRKIRTAAIEALGEIGGAEAARALEQVRPRRWQPYLSYSVRQARAQIEAQDQSTRGIPRSPLSRTRTALAARLSAVVTVSLLVVLAASKMFDADLNTTALVALTAFVLLLPWHVLRRGTDAGAADWVRTADECNQDAASLEPPWRTVLRVHRDTFLGLPIDIGLVGIGALLTYPEVAAGVVAGSPGFVRFAMASRWMRDWEKRNGVRLFKETRGPDEHRRRFLIPG